MKNTSVFRLQHILGSIVRLLRKPTKGKKEKEKIEIGIRKLRREWHFAIGENPIFTPRRGKLKGYMKQQGRKKGYHKFQTH